MPAAAAAVFFSLSIYLIDFGPPSLLMILFFPFNFRYVLLLLLLDIFSI
jgi:hypothetical protein